MKYYTDGSQHFYRINKDNSILHIMKADFDKTYEKDYDGLLVVQTNKKGDICINLLNRKKLKVRDLIPMSELEFNKILTASLLNLGISEYTKSI